MQLQHVDQDDQVYDVDDGNDDDDSCSAQIHTNAIIIPLLSRTVFASYSQALITLPVVPLFFSARSSGVEHVGPGVPHQL